jgi:hypothetical protein
MTGQKQSLLLQAQQRKSIAGRKRAGAAAAIIDQGICIRRAKSSFTATCGTLTEVVLETGTTSNLTFYT